MSRAFKKEIFSKLSGINNIRDSMSKDITCVLNRIEERILYQTTEENEEKILGEELLKLTVLCDELNEARSKFANACYHYNHPD